MNDHHNPSKADHPNSGLEARKSANQGHSPNMRALAHELRTPIGAIMAFAEMIEREQFGPIDDQRYLDYARNIRDSARLALGIVAGSLDERAEEPELLMAATAQIDLGQSIEATLRLLAPAAEEAGVRLEFAAPETPIELETDSMALQQIILNLAGNGIKFTPPDGAVTVSVTRHQGAEVRIADSGLGMTCSDAALLIGADSEHSNKSQGIGFSLVRTLCAKIGARMSVQTKRGVGTTVTLNLNKPEPTAVDAASQAKM